MFSKSEDEEFLRYIAKIRKDTLLGSLEAWGEELKQTDITSIITDDFGNFEGIHLVDPAMMGGAMSVEMLMACFPGVPIADATTFANSFNAWCTKLAFQPNAQFLTCFLATVKHENGGRGLQPIGEYGGSGKKYAPYYGRGYIQITHDFTYKDLNGWLNANGMSVDIVNNPDALLSSIDISVASSLWFILIYKKSTKIVEWGLGGDIINFTKIIRGSAGTDRVGTYTTFFPLVVANMGKGGITGAMPNVVTNFRSSGRMNINAACSYLLNNVKGTSSKSGCAHYVRLAINAGGIATPNNPVPAQDYMHYLPSIGFKCVASFTAPGIFPNPQPGDISVQTAVPNHTRPEGHICMYCGKYWYSDFIQSGASGMWGGPGYRQYGSTCGIFRI
jgi:hypothetical protein